MSNSLTIRQAKRGDIKALLALTEEFKAYMDRKAKGLPKRELARRSRLFATRQKNFVKYGFGKGAAFHTLIAIKDGVPVGYACYNLGYDPDEMQGKVASLLDLFVVERLRGSGIGKSIMKRLAWISRKNGCIAIYFLVWERNSVVMKFYEKLGSEWIKDMRLMRLEI